MSSTLSVYESIPTTRNDSKLVPDTPKRNETCHSGWRPGSCSSLQHQAPASRGLDLGHRNRFSEKSIVEESTRVEC